MDLEQLPERTALWAVGISVVVFMTLLMLPVQDDQLRRIQRWGAIAALSFGFGVAALWVLSNYVFVPEATP